MSESCKGCHYSKTQRGVLICRRYPPTLSPTVAPEQPSVYPTDWCGEFRPMRPLGRDATPAVVGPKPSFSHGRAKVMTVGAAKARIAREVSNGDR